MFLKRSRQTVGLFGLAGAGAILWTATAGSAQSGDPAHARQREFGQHIQPFLKDNCVRCHNSDLATAGIRLDHLNEAFEDREIRLWERVRTQVAEGTMPPKGLPQPSSADRGRVAEWITQSLDMARVRTAPKNGMVRRLTVAQYRNTLRDLLLLEDDLAEALPPDAVSRDGFVNNRETLQLSPLLTEAYFEIAEEALSRATVDPNSKPSIQNFRLDLGASINPKPFPDELVLGAGSQLLNNKDFVVSQITPTKPFSFEPHVMQTRFRFIEGYQGNDTVRGWRDFDSIYHAVFADMRGSPGYPKGLAYSTVPEGLLLRPAIPNDEIFGADGTYGPKANFKIALRELPNHGRFRVTVTAARYNDGLLLDPGATPQTREGAQSLNFADGKAAQSVAIKTAGIYQVDVYPAARPPAPAPDTSRLNEGLAASWVFNDSAEGIAADKQIPVRLEGKAALVESPFGKSVSLSSDADSVIIPSNENFNVGAGDFTVQGWINPRIPRKAGLISFGTGHGTHGWHLDVPARGVLRLETFGPGNQPNGSVTSRTGAIRGNVWQHVAAVVRRQDKEARLYVNGYLVAKGPIGSANLDNPQASLHLGRIPDTQPFRGQLDEVRIYRRALGEAEIQGLVEPGREFAKPPADRPEELTLTLGDRHFTGALTQPAFLAVRLEAGEAPVTAEYSNALGLDRIVFTPLPGSDDLAQRFATFEKRTPRLGVHLGFRRDCGSTFAPVGEAQKVGTDKLARYVFEGAIRNFPTSEAEKGNVNYLAGIREIAVRSEYTDGRDLPRLLIRSIEFEGPLYETWPPPSHRNIFIDSARKNDATAYARQIARNFAARAYRRPISEAEEAVLMETFRNSFAGKQDFSQSVKDMLQVVLTSPQFLFLIEKSRTSAAEPIDDHELASKLSYFLWNGPPDRAALRLAGSGTLRKQLDSEVERMIGDPRFGRFLREFTPQWLALDKFQVLEPDRKQFPKLTRHARAQLVEEPVQFLQHLIRNNLPVRNLITSDFVVANEAVASYYELGDRTESGLNFVAIPHGRRELGGVLTQAAILAGLSDGRESNPVKRGAWLARRIMAEPPDDPPPNVPALKEDTSSQRTLRERIEQHRNQSACRQCHAKIDPWGVALEEFDAGGRLKQKAADARSKLPDNTEVAGIEDLKRYLTEQRIDQVAFSVLKHLATYANGRSLTYAELNSLRNDALTMKPTGYRLKDMIRYVAASRMFLEK